MEINQFINWKTKKENQMFSCIFHISCIPEDPESRLENLLLRGIPINPCRKKVKIRSSPFCNP